MHTYATLAQFRDYIRDNGSQDLGQANDATLLGFLEGASRRVEGFCHRSKYGSGFGPRIGINYYDGDGCNELYLDDDLVSLSAFTVAATTGGSPASPTVTTDYFLATFGGAYSTPYRKVILHGQGSPTTFGQGYQTVVATGTWGYQSTTLPVLATVASGLSVGTSQTTFVTSASPDLSPGATLLIGSEALYLRALDGTTATVTRGANGTTAATHIDASAIAVHTYPEDVVTATLQVALRRWKLRDAGSMGDYGGGQMPTTGPRDTEASLLWATLRDLVIPVA